MSIARVSLALLMTAAACAGPKAAKQDTATTTATATPADRAAKAAAISNAIAANPAAADSILKANGYSQEQFQKEMYDIAADSAQSAAYAAAKTK